MKTTPYELVFEQPPHFSVFPGAKGNCVMEEDVEDLFEENPTTDPSQNAPQIETMSEPDSQMETMPKPDIHPQIEFETMSEQCNSDTCPQTETMSEQCNSDTYPQTETMSEQCNSDTYPQTETTSEHLWILIHWELQQNTSISVKKQMSIIRGMLKA